MSAYGWIRRGGLVIRNVRCPVRPCAVRTGRPGNPGLTRRIKPEQRDTAILSKWETIQIHATNCDIAAHNDRRFLPCVASRDGDCAIQFKRLRERPFAIVFLGRFPHQTRINHKQVSTGVILQQLDCSPHHVRKIRLLAALLDLICERELRIAKSAKKRWAPPRRDRIQLGSGTDDIKTVSAELEQKIAFVLSFAALCSRKK